MKQNRETAVNKPAAAGLLAGYLTRAQLARGLRKSVRTIKRWEFAGVGPPPTRFGADVYYRREAVQAWLRSREKPPGRVRQRRRLGPHDAGATLVREGATAGAPREN